MPIAHLPPDPDNENNARAASADEALHVFAAVTGLNLEIEPEAVLPDLLCDLMHWCDRSGQDFDDCLRRARNFHTEETTV